MKQKAFFIIVKELSIKQSQTFLEGESPTLILYFELTFCFEIIFRNSFLICSFFSCYNIFTLTIYLTIKHIYIGSLVSRIINSFKDVLLGLRTFLATENPLKMMKNAFYFTLKPLFVLKTFNLFSCLFGQLKKRLDL